jgi:hypothetical protein
LRFKEEADSEFQGIVTETNSPPHGVSTPWDAMTVIAKNDFERLKFTVLTKGARTPVVLRAEERVVKIPCLGLARQCPSGAAWWDDRVHV